MNVSLLANVATTLPIVDAVAIDTPTLTVVPIAVAVHPPAPETPPATPKTSNVASPTDRLDICNKTEIVACTQSMKDALDEAASIFVLLQNVFEISASSVQKLVATQLKETGTSLKKCYSDNTAFVDVSSLKHTILDTQKLVGVCFELLQPYAADAAACNTLEQAATLSLCMRLRLLRERFAHNTQNPIFHANDQVALRVLTFWLLRSQTSCDSSPTL